jgi:hypothetical protein
MPKFRRPNGGVAGRESCKDRAGISGVSGAKTVVEAASCRRQIDAEQVAVCTSVRLVMSLAWGVLDGACGGGG